MSIRKRKQAVNDFLRIRGVSRHLTLIHPAAKVSDYLKGIEVGAKPDSYIGVIQLPSVSIWTTVYFKPNARASRKNYKKYQADDSWQKFKYSFAVTVVDIGIERMLGAVIDTLTNSEGKYGIADSFTHDRLSDAEKETVLCIHYPVRKIGNIVKYNKITIEVLGDVSNIYLQ